MNRQHQLPHERVTEDLRHRIEAGEWDHGEALPTVAALAEHYRVSPATISKAVRPLAAEGLIVTRQRWGMFRA